MPWRKVEMPAISSSVRTRKLESRYRLIWNDWSQAFTQLPSIYNASLNSRLSQFRVIRAAVKSIGKQSTGRPLSPFTLLVTSITTRCSEKLEARRIKSIRRESFFSRAHVRSHFEHSREPARFSNSLICDNIAARAHKTKDEPVITAGTPFHRQAHMYTLRV